MSLQEAISPTARGLLVAHKHHLAWLRELDARLAACQTAEAEDQVQKLIEIENRRWSTLQQQTEK